MVADTGTLTAVLREFLTVFKLGQTAVSHKATSLLSILAAIELILAGLGWAVTGNDALNGLFRKILLISFFVFVIDNYESLLRTVIEGFIYTGKTAAIGSADVFASFQDPSSIIDTGFKATTPIVAHMQTLSLWPPPIFDTVLSTFSLFFILGAFFIIAIQVFVTYLEFAMISTVALIFIPFGVFKHTAFLSEKTFAAVIAFGVKLMVLGLIVSVAMPVLKTLELPPDPTFAQLFQMVMVCLAIAGLAWHAPGVASALLAGGPSLTAHTALHAGAAGVVAGTAAAVGAVSAPRVANEAVSKVAQAAGYGLGKVSGNAQVRAARSETQRGSEIPPPTPPSPVQRAASRMANATVAIASSASQAVQKRTITPIRESYERGKSSAPHYVEVRTQQEVRSRMSSDESTKAASELHAENPSSPTDRTDRSAKEKPTQAIRENEK